MKSKAPQYTMRNFIGRSIFCDVPHIFFAFSYLLVIINTLSLLSRLILGHHADKIRIVLVHVSA